MELNENGIALLSTTNVPFDAIAAISLYTVPPGTRLLIDHVKVEAGSDAAATIVSVGQVGALTDFVPNNTLSNLDAQYDVVIIKPIPNTTPLKNKSYAAGTVIQMDVTTAVGGATNAGLLFGTLKAA